MVVRNLSMQETDRHYWIYMSSMYRDPLVYLREVYQNAVDAASPILALRRTDKGLVASDSGTGMTRNFIESVWPRPGLSVKGSNRMGRYSEGRLTYLRPFAALVGENLVLNGSVTVVSSTGTETTKIDWQHPRSLSTEDVPVQPKGTTITWEIKPGDSADKYLPSVADIEKYLSKIVVMPRLTVTLNGRELKLGWAAEKVQTDGQKTLQGYSSEVGEYLKFPYDIYFSPDAHGGITVTENGIFVQHINLGGGKFGGIMDFKPVSSSTGQPAGIANVSRDALSMHYGDVIQAYIEEGIIAPLAALSREELEKRSADVLAFLSADVFRGYEVSNDLYNKAAGLIVINGKTIAELVKEGYLWSIAGDIIDEEYVERAVQKGYKVQAVSKELAIVLERMGMKSLNTIAEELRREFRFKEIGTKRTISILASLSEFELQMQQTFNGLLEDCMGELIAIFKGDIERGAVPYDHPGMTGGWSSLGEMDSVSGDDGVEAVTKPIKFMKWQVFFGKCSDPNMPGFYYQGRIGFNLNNPYVLDAVEKGNQEYLVFVLTQEIVHALGFNRPNEVFVKALNIVYGKFLLKTESSRSKLDKLAKSLSRDSRTQAPPPLPPPAIGGSQEEVVAKALALKLLGKMNKE